MRKIFMSLSAKLCFYILTLTVVIFGCIAYVFREYSVEREEAQASRYAAVLLQNMILKMDRKLAEVEQTVTLTLPLLKQELDHPDRLRDIVGEYVWEDADIMGGCIAFEPPFSPLKDSLLMEYAFIDSLGHLQSKRLGNADYDYTQMQWYTEAKSRMEGIWSEPYYDEGGGNAMMTTYSLPLTSQDGQLIAVVTADVSLDDIVSDINGLRPYPESYSFILSATGTYLSHPDSDVILRQTISTRASNLHSDALADIGKAMTSGQRGTTRLQLENIDVLASYAPMLRTGWSLCCVTPYQIVMDELGSATLTVLFILLAGLLLLLICIRWILVEATRPMTQLAEATRQIAAGHFDVTLPEIGGKDEMSKLHDAFAHMQTSLSQYMEELTQTTRQKERIESELHIARTIQMSMIPQIFSPFPEWEDLELHAYLHPAKEVGGDFYDFFIRDEKLFFVIGDVSGKGVPASLLMAIMRTLFRIMAGAYDSPARIMSILNHAAAEKNEANMFITSYVGALCLQTGRLTFCNAGHDAPLLASPDGACHVQQVKPHLPLGVIDGFLYTDEELQLADGTAMLLFTDGLTEAENLAHEQLGEARVEELMQQYATLDTRTVVEKMVQEVSNFAGEAEQSDDLTLLCLRFHQPKATAPTQQPPLELLMRNHLEDSSLLHPFVESMGETFGLQPALVSSLCLALEEAVVNSIQYAYPEGTEGNVRLTASLDAEHHTLTFVLTDSGMPFDPTLMPDADTTLSVDDRPIGGLGIFLIRQIMDSVSYERRANDNVLIMKKVLG